MNAKKTVILLMVLMLITATINIVSNLIAMSREFTSFPWWSVFVFALYYFGPVLLIEGLALLGIHIWQKRKQD